MGTTFGELKRQVMLRIQRTDGEAWIAIEEGINEAQYNIARVRDFSELIVLDTDNALTQPNVKFYHIADDLKLVRPKDIYSIRYMDGADSRKLIYTSPRVLDEVIPYTELLATGRPKFYTRRGSQIELIPIPDASKPLYVVHSQWPPKLVEASDETPYENLDDVIVTLAADIALSILNEGGGGNWFERARQLLGISIKEEDIQPDVKLVARPFQATASSRTGRYWLNPWVGG